MLREIETGGFNDKDFHLTFAFAVHLFRPDT